MTKRTVVFSDRPFSNIFKYWDHRWDLATIWNTRLLQTPTEEFFRTTTGILVLEGKTGKEILELWSLEFLIKFLGNNFPLPDPEDNTSRSINSRFIFVENTISDSPKIWEPSFWEVINSSAFISICKFGSLKILLEQLLACLSFTLDWDLFSWYKQRKWFP